MPLWALASKAFNIPSPVLSLLSGECPLLVIGGIALAKVKTKVNIPAYCLFCYLISTSFQLLLVSPSLAYDRTL
jgi:hypothetical protein